jgi:N-methylhydantoinase B
VKGVSNLSTPDVFVGIMSSGGGGFGDPLERSVARVAEDLSDGKVSPEMAAEVYGIVIASDGSPDVAATDARRAGIRQERLQKAGLA